MKISTKGRYGIRILFDIALNGSGRPRMMREIAKSQGISEKYISRLILDLRDAGFISATRGARGGYSLVRTPADISLLNVVETMEGHISIVDRIDIPDTTDKGAVYGMRDVWLILNGKVREALASVSLQDIIERHESAEVPAAYSI